MNISIIGATGYAGVELLRILHNHPEAKIMHLTSESSAGKKISDVYEHLRGIYDQKLISIDNIDEIAARTVEVKKAKLTDSAKAELAALKDPTAAKAARTVKKSTGQARPTRAAADTDSQAK